MWVLAVAAVCGVVAGCAGDESFYGKRSARTAGRELAQSRPKDRNGNGATDAGETALDNVDTDYDGRSDSQELAEATDPADPASVTAMGLGYWRFNTSDWKGEQGQMPKASANLQQAASWSGYALQVNQANPAYLTYRDLETGGGANLNCRCGSVRFWFKPGWVSGVGPGAWGRLLEAGDGTSQGGWWALSVTADGTQLRFESQLGGQSTLYLTSGSLGWTLGGNNSNWHQMVLTYSPSATALYIDGQLSASGGGIVSYPTAAARAACGFTIGANRLGGEQAKGQFEELETFNYVLAPEEITVQYQAMSDPPVFSVEYENRCVTNTVVTAIIEGGPSARMAVLVNDTNFTSATWVPFTTNLVVSLGAGDGEREVWYGLKGWAEDADERWVAGIVTVDTVPPVVAITAPVTSTVSQPRIQVKGYSPEPLSHIEYDLANQLTWEPGRLGSLVEQHFDRESLRITTNWFRLSNVGLAPGTNTLVLRVWDEAGNLTTTNLGYTHSLAGDTTAPVVTLHWPREGTRISGDSFTLRGRVDDETAAVSATVVGGGGSITKTGRVDYVGQFWVEGLPLASGSNQVTLTVTDAAGNAAVSAFTVVGSSLVLRIDPVQWGDVRRARTAVTGWVSDSARVVWVNGIQATVAPDGAWAAADVPMNYAGVATAQARAYLPGEAPAGREGPFVPGCSGTDENPATHNNPPRPNAVDAERCYPGATPVAKVHSGALESPRGIRQPELRRAPLTPAAGTNQRREPPKVRQPVEVPAVAARDEPLRWELGGKVPPGGSERLIFLYDLAYGTHRMFRRALPEDRSMLHVLYQKRKTPWDRCPVLWGLIYAGDDRVVGLLKNALTEEYRGQVFAGEHRQALVEAAIRQMGYLAQTNEQALAFLTNAVTVEFWRQHRAWKLKDEREVDDDCAQSAVSALGISGRAEALPVLDRIQRECEAQGRQAKFASALLDAMFAHETYAQLGLTIFRQRYDDRHPMVWQEWERTPSGRTWWAWRKRFPPFPEKPQR